MRAIARLASVPLALGALSSCAAPDGPRPTEAFGRLNVSVAPLTLPGITEACYGLEVSNAAETVFEESSICSTAYGDGKGAVTFVGSCDATSDSDGGQAGIQNRVEVVLNSLSANGAALATSEYVNPCTALSPCVQHATCSENTDTPVTFELAIMRDAEQGFFDIAVNFSDIFCSAKVDCREAFLFDGGLRSRTAIVAFACTAGSSEQTNMYLDDISLGGQTFDVGGAEGNRMNASGTPYAIYRDVENLPGVGEKAYWNVAISIKNLSGTLATMSTASSSALEVSGSSFRTSLVSKYPVITYSVAVPSGTSCFAEQQLDASGSGVNTAYTPLGSPALFDKQGDVSAGEVVVSSAGGGVAPLASVCTSDAQCEAGAWCPTDTVLRRCAPNPALAAGVAMPFQFVPAAPAPTGFVMGSPVTELGRATTGETQVTTYLTGNYFVSRTEVTQGQWKAISGGVNPSFFQTPTCTDSTCNSNENANDSGPVEDVDWYSAVGFVNALSAAEGLSACYTLTGCSDMVDGWKDGTHDGCTGATFVGYGCAGYRLLTEAEWERAARGESTQATYNGNLSSVDCSDTTLSSIAWFCGNAGSKSHEVGGKSPNVWGLHDMFGNVSEWVWDWYANYTAGATDPTGPASGSYRVDRGGNWYYEAKSLRAASRPRYLPDVHIHELGLRVARSSP